MAWKNISKVNPGDPILASTINDLIDNVKEIANVLGLDFAGSDARTCRITKALRIAGQTNLPNRNHVALILEGDSAAWPPHHYIALDAKGYQAIGVGSGWTRMGDVAMNRLSANQKNAVAAGYVMGCVESVHGMAFTYEGIWRIGMFGFRIVHFPDSFVRSTRGPALFFAQGIVFPVWVVAVTRKYAVILGVPFTRFSGMAMARARMEG